MLSRKQKAQVRTWAAEGKGLSEIAAHLGCHPNDDDLCIAFAEGRGPMSEEEAKREERRFQRTHGLRRLS